MAKFLKEISSVIGARSAKGEIHGFLALMQQVEPMRTETLQVAGFSGLARVLSLTRVRGLKNPLAERLLLRQALISSSERLQAAARDLARNFELANFFAKAERETLDSSIPIDKRERPFSCSVGGRSLG